MKDRWISVVSPVVHPARDKDFAMLSRRSFASLVLGGATLALTRPLLAQTAPFLSVTHVQGTTEVPLSPKRVVVLDMTALDTLDTLGAPVLAVPSGPKPENLAKYADDDAYPKAGSLFEPDYEAINALAPDLIVVGGRSAPKYAELARLAPTIDLTIDQTRYLDSALDHARTLGRIFGLETVAEERIATLNADIAILRTRTGGIGTGLLILTTGGKMSAYGPGSRFGAVHDIYGVTPADPGLEVSLHGQAISFEYILKTNPDWLFVIDRDAAIGRSGQSAAQFLDNAIVHQTTAWKGDQVVYLNSADWYLVGGGLGALDRTVKGLTSALDRA